MPKFHKGDLVAIVPRRLGTEVIDPEPVPGLVRVRIATIDILTGGNLRQERERAGKRPEAPRADKRDRPPVGYRSENETRFMNHSSLRSDDRKVWDMFKKHITAKL